MINANIDLKLCKWTVTEEDSTLFKILLYRIIEPASVAIFNNIQLDQVEYIAWATDSEILAVSQMFTNAGFSFVKNDESEKTE